MSAKLNPIYLPALKGRIGKWAFYTALMKFSEVAERIHLSDELYQNKNLSDMVQRAVKKSRVGAIAKYLNTEDERFFPAMVIAVFDGKPNWMDFSIRKQSKELDLDLSGLDISKWDSIGLLILNGDERLFPLDGQHRLAGIRAALGRPEATENFLPDDEVVVMLVGHEQSKTGRMRSRRLFTVLNKRAVPVKKHETIALDEDDVMAISSRHLVEQYKPLSRTDIVLMQANASIPPDNSSAFTTIVTIYDMLSDFFPALSGRNATHLKYNRPDDSWLQVYHHCAERFFSLMMDTFSDVGDCLAQNGSSRVIAENRRQDGGHIMFRPVGQRLMARLVAAAIRGTYGEKFEDKNVMPKKVQKAAYIGLKNTFAKFSTLPTELSEKPYAKLIWEPDTGRMQVARWAIVRDVILKKYGLLGSIQGNNLDARLKSSVGERYVAEDFFW